MNNLSRPHLFGMLAGLFLAAGLVASCFLATTAFLKIKNSQFISVKGSARKNITSDLAIWRGSFMAKGETLLDAQRRLGSDREQVRQFLSDRNASNFIFAPINIEEVNGACESNGLRFQQIIGYRLTQGVRVESRDVQQVLRLDPDSIQLVEKGLQFAAQAPEFIYTKAGEAKIEMLAEAVKDARARAEQVATQGGRMIARLHNAEMGVFQITPLYSTQTSWDGMSDMSSVEKTITAVVTASFELK